MFSAVNRIALKSILHKEVHRFMRIWVQTLVPPLLLLAFILLFLVR